MTDAIAPVPAAHMIPGDFAEKAMASLMSLHSELMDEKERRVELYRKLMEREQTVAELRMYIRVLEEKLEPHAEVARPAPAPPPLPLVQAYVAPRLAPQTGPQPVIAAPPEPAPPASAYTREPTTAPPLPPRVGRPKVDGWKTW
jgi:hypothetical protein